MQRELKAYLSDALAAIEKIRRFAGGVDDQQYLSDEYMQSAVERQLEIVGEALRQASQHFPEELGEMQDARSAIALRHRLAHGYLSTDPVIIWQVVAEDLPRLEERLREMITKPS